MPDLSVTVTDFAPQFAKAIKAVGADTFGVTFPNTMAAMNMVAHNYYAQWRKAATGEQLPGMPYAINSRGPYRDSLHIDLSNDQLKEIYSTGEYTDWIESGHGEIDLKPGMLNGPKARQGKNGPYNIIAFRNGTPNTLPSNNPMPVNVYNLIKKETDKADRAYGSGQTTKPGTSRITGQQKVPSSVAGGKPSIQRDYQWGYRVPESAGGRREIKNTNAGRYQWKTGKHTGMVRMATDTAGAKSSEYITFRIVSIHSDPASWILPVQEANPIRQAVIDSLQKDTEEILKMAMEEDLSLGGA